MSRDVDVNLIDLNGFSFFGLVCVKGYNEILLFLIENGVNINFFIEIEINFFVFVCLNG